MNVSCPACRSVFRVDPAKVPAAGVRARCSVCGSLIDVASRPAAGANAAEDVSYASVQAPTGMTVPVSTRVEDESSADATRSAVAEADPVESPTNDEVRTATPVSTSVSPDGDPAAPFVAAAPDVNAPRTRPVNPYLNNTPELRARRLARALVSDLVAYNPQKREEGLRDGTLRQLFRDEIRKSWDEYVEQVGAAVAESTPHFQDALNDVLAGGRRVF